MGKLVEEKKHIPKINPDAVCKLKRIVRAT